MPALLSPKGVPNIAPGWIDNAFSVGSKLKIRIVGRTDESVFIRVHLWFLSILPAR